MSIITINRGSDLTLTGTWRDASGAAMDFTGWEIGAFEPSASMASALNIEWIDPAQGTYRVVMQWAKNMQSGMTFRLRVSSSSSDLTSPEITVFVQ